MVEAAVSDVIRPTVATHDPYALFDEHVDDGEKLASVGGVERRQLFFQKVNTLALFVNVRLVFLFRGQDSGDEFFANASRNPAQQFVGKFSLLVDGDAESQPKLGVVLEQGIGPGGPSPVRILGPRCSGEIAPVN